MQCSSSTGSLTRETSVPSKSMLRSRIFIVDLTIDSIVSRSKSKRVKSAYELAMERLEKDKPTIALANEQKEQLADVDSTYKAKIAERELFLRDEIRKAQAAGNFEEVEKLEKQLSSEIARLREDCERKKEKLRASFAK